jgi:hypothetical protein
MADRFGNRATFAVEIGPPQGLELRMIDLWAGGQWLTRDDNVAFVPFVERAMRATAQQLRQRDLPGCPFPGRAPQEIYRLLDDDGELRESFWFLQWGEVVDNVSLYAYLDAHLVLVFQFWRDAVPTGTAREVFTASVPVDEFVASVESAADALRGDGA